MSSRKKKKIPVESFEGRQQRLMDEEAAKYPYYRLVNGIAFILFVIALLLTMWEVKIYQSTFIPIYIPLLIWLLPGLAVTPFLYKTLNIYIFNPYNPGRLPIWAHLLNNMVITGGIMVSAFMFVNYHFARQPVYSSSVPITYAGHFARGGYGCANPFVIVIYKDKEKQLVFPCDTNVEQAHAVQLQLKEGFFGFEVIVNKSLENK